MGQAFAIERVVLRWEAAHASEYDLQVSLDAQTWTTMITRAGGTGGTEAVSVSGTGRYVRGRARSAIRNGSTWISARPTR